MSRPAFRACLSYLLLAGLWLLGSGTLPHGLAPQAADVVDQAGVHHATWSDLDACDAQNESESESESEPSDEESSPLDEELTLPTTALCLVARGDTGSVDLFYRHSRPASADAEIETPPPRA